MNHDSCGSVNISAEQCNYCFVDREIDMQKYIYLGPRNHGTL